MNNLEFLPAQGRHIYLLAGIVHLRESRCLRGCGADAKKIYVCKPFHFCCRKHEEAEPLVGGGFTVLLDVVANFFHDLLIIGIVAQVVVVFVPLEPWVVVVAKGDGPAQPR